MKRRRKTIIPSVYMAWWKSRFHFIALHSD